MTLLRSRKASVAHRAQGAPMSRRLGAMPRIRECHDGLFQGAIAERVVAAFHAVQAALGITQPMPVYRRALMIGIARRGLAVTPPRAVGIVRDGSGITTMRPDLVVESRVAVCLASGSLTQPDEATLRAYLEATQLELGLLLRFGTPPSVCRIVWQGGGVSAPPRSSPGPHPVPRRTACPTP